MRSNGLSKQFGGLKALSDVSFSIRKGEIMSLIGPNGAGKTTCLNLVTGFFKPSAGTVRYCDDDITGLPPHAAAQRGLVRTFQKTNVLRGLSGLRQRADRPLPSRREVAVANLLRRRPPARA